MKKLILLFSVFLSFQANAAQTYFCSSVLQTNKGYVVTTDPQVTSVQDFVKNEDGSLSLGFQWQVIESKEQDVGLISFSATHEYYTVTSAMTGYLELESSGIMLRLELWSEESPVTQFVGTCSL